MENTKDNKIFFIMPAAIFLATVLALSTFTILHLHSLMLEKQVKMFSKVLVIYRFQDN
jgi:hypothetical protein